MVEMICGAYGAKGRLIRPADGPFSLSAEEEKRLVNRGVARYVQEYAEPAPPTPPPGEPEGSEGEGGQENHTEPSQPEPRKPAKAKKSGKPKPDDSIPPDLTPEGPVV